MKNQLVSLEFEIPLQLTGNKLWKIDIEDELGMQSVVQADASVSQQAIADWLDVPVEAVTEINPNSNRCKLVGSVDAEIVR